MKSLARSILSRFGLTVGRTLPGGLLIDHDLQDAFESDFQLVRPFTMLNRQRLGLVFELARHFVTTGIAGAFVECGVWKGGAVGMMACAAKRSGEERDLHLCDVFDDIGEPDWRVDGERAVREVGGKEHAQGRLRPIKGIYDFKGGHGTIEACRELLERRIGYSPTRLHFHQGWFQETLPDLGLAIGPIAFLRIDADWYASTQVVLTSLYASVVSGGAIVVDDYGA
jgi:O-methyltransferase